MNSTSVLHWAPQSGTATGTGKAIDAWTKSAALAGATLYVISQNQPSRAGSPGNVSYLGDGLGRWTLLIKFRSQIRTVDVVHLHGAFDPTLSLILLFVGIEKLRRAFTRNRLNAVLTPHGALAHFVFQKNRARKRLYWHLLDKWLMRLVDEFICNTPMEAKQLKRRLPKAACVVIPLVIDHHKAISNPINTRHIEGQSVPVLCTIGRYDIGIKGLDLLIHAVVSLNQEGLNVKLRCIGYDRQGGIAELQQFVNSVDAGTYVECTGPKYGSEKKKLLMDSNVFCVPSRYESFSYSLMEGLQSGLPVLVGSGACVTSYFNSEQKSQLMVEPCVEAWTAAIRRVLSDPNPNQEYSAKAALLFSEIGNAETVGTLLCDRYAAMTSK